MIFFSVHFPTSINVMSAFLPHYLKILFFYYIIFILEKRGFGVARNKYRGGPKATPRDQGVARGHPKGPGVAAWPPQNGYEGGPKATPEVAPATFASHPQTPLFYFFFLKKNILR
jgi:hypothetical protein